MRGGEGVNADLVVFDEAHYLSDRDRGHVWEEAIILTPPRVRLLLLSATVGRAEEFAAWIAEVRGTSVRIVSRPGARPVPLRAAFLYPDGELTPLLDEAGRFNSEIARFMQTTKDEGRQSHGRFSGGGRGGGPARRPGMQEMPPSSLLASLGSYDLLPAIVFMPTRKRCDESASEAAFAPRRVDGARERREARHAILDELAEQYPEVRKHRHWETVVRGGVASHHAGHLPAWKLAIERLMSAGALDAIFATATVAAGVDFPARTVVLANIDVRRGQGWQTLSASEMQQMTGRAGRRGRDRVGFIVAAPGPHQDAQKMAALLSAPPDPLESQFRATYTTLLNLLDAYGTFAQVRDIAERSFARRDAVEDVARLERERVAAERRMKEKLAEAVCWKTRRARAPTCGRAGSIKRSCRAASSASVAAVVASSSSRSGAATDSSGRGKTGGTPRSHSNASAGFSPNTIRSPETAATRLSTACARDARRRWRSHACAMPARRRVKPSRSLMT